MEFDATVSGIHWGLGKCLLQQVGTWALFRRTQMLALLSSLGDEALGESGSKTITAQGGNSLFNRSSRIIGLRQVQLSISPTSLPPPYHSGFRSGNGPWIGTPEGLSERRDVLECSRWTRAWERPKGAEKQEKASGDFGDPGKEEGDCRLQARPQEGLEAKGLGQLSEESLGDTPLPIRRGLEKEGSQSRALLARPRDCFYARVHISVIRAHGPPGASGCLVERRGCWGRAVPRPVRHGQASSSSEQGSCDGTARPVTPEQPGHSWLLRNQGDTEEPLRTQTGAGRTGFAGDPWPRRLDSQLPVCLLGPVAGLVHAIGLPLGPGPSAGTSQDRGWARAVLHPERPESRVLKCPAQRWRGASTATCHTSCDQSSDRSGRPGLGCSSVAEHLTGTQEKRQTERT
ncbi:uncharacterized protein LOC124099345 [Marmota monax]|uniref:uncharacterized protein LOC124099345 n=1 Tax=Marmota monax TaxID=9995 RepID=UPI001EB027FA|nr:uncharacterized protein LOC124099345 [Marmota monax]